MESKKYYTIAMENDKLALLRGFVESLETSDALLKESVLEGIDVMLENSPQKTRGTAAGKLTRADAIKALAELYANSPPYNDPASWRDATDEQILAAYNNHIAKDSPMQSLAAEEPEPEPPGVLERIASTAKELWNAPKGGKAFQRQINKAADAHKKR